MVEEPRHIFEVAHHSPHDRALIERAYRCAAQAHAQQTRADGSPYITHPTAVAQFLADYGLDAASIAAAFLHDVIEDCGISRAELERQFGAEVAFLVDGVSKLKTIQLRNAGVKPKDPQIESLKKMFFAMARDLRVIIIKLADRLHNMRTLSYTNPQTRVQKAVETLEIYAPIAERLGMGRIKGELEDLAFPYARPAEHAWLKRIIKGKYEDRLRYIERAAPLVRHYLEQAGIQVLDLHARAKRMWSLYRKLQRYQLDPDKVLDLVALRVIVPDVKSCYEVLGVIHTHYKPMPGRVKDYIALPKPNGYQSLHTTVFCEKGRIAEIQIRTPAMHDHAENGVAAHWAYKENGRPIASSVAKQQELEWINKLKTFLKDTTTRQGIADMTIDFFKNRIFALTPHGDVKDLAEGATPVDFAYAVHSELGHRVMGATVNGKLVPINYQLQSGDVVEIQRGKDARPSKNWLRFVRTTQAAKHIRSWFRQHEQEAPSTEERAVRLKKRPERRQQPVVPSPGAHHMVLISGQVGLAYRIGRCCSPAAGSSITGYLTRTKGVTVHATTCANVKTADVRRLLEARWS